MVPQALPLQPLPEMLHATVLSLGPLTEAENCCVPPSTTTAVVGLMLTVVDVLPLLLHAESMAASRTTIATER